MTSTNISDYENAIAIVGMACRMPGDCDLPEKFWQLLIENRDAITDVPSNRWNMDDYYDPNPKAQGKMITRKGGFISNVDLFDANFFKITPNEAEDVDPQQRILLETAWEAIENANIPARKLKATTTGVFIGISSSDYANMLASRGDPEQLSVHFIAGKDLSAAAGRISYFLGLEGPSLSIDTATSSSLVAIHYACKELLQGTCAYALAGGVNLILAPEPTIYRSRARMLSPDGYCKAFDASANGYTRSEGCGVLVLKRYQDAVNDNDEILAVIRSSAVRQDGSSKGFTAPNPAAQRAVIKLALSDAKLTPKDIDYIEAHGTGTPLGDPVEIQALGDIFENSHSAEHPLIIESLKNNIGHLEAASGVASVIKVALALKNERIPAHIHFSTLNPKIDLHSIPAIIPTQNLAWPKNENRLRRAGISSFGLTGTNCHLILEEAPPTKIQTAIKRPLHIFTLSAIDATALKAYAQKYIDYLSKNPSLDLGDLCYSVTTGRNHFSYRIAILTSSLPDLITKLEKFTQGEKDPDMDANDIARHLGLTFSLTEDLREIPENDLDSWRKLLDGIRRFYLQGFEVDWEHLNRAYVSRKIHLPTYPFQRERFWSEILESKK
jgi:acyl transferase domain-containing protein